MKKKVLYLFLVILLLVFSESAYAVYVEENAIHDVTLSSLNPDYSNNGNYLDVGTNFRGCNVSLLRFDQSTIPAGAVIDSAWLRLYAFSAAGSLFQIQIYQMGEIWSETTATWNNIPYVDPSSPVITYNVLPLVAGNYLQYNVTQIVQEWANGDPNFGIGLGFPSGCPPDGDYISYVSDEHPDDGHPHDQRPTLEVDYHIADDSYEENDTIDDAYGLNDGVWLSEDDGLGVQLDEDWYRIYIDSLRHMRIECTFDHSEGDIDIELYDSDGWFLMESDSESDNEYITFDVLPPNTQGYYYVRVVGGNAGNTYDLWYEDTPSCVDNDGDGYDSENCIGGTDCNDSNSSINPGATETCNGIDDDCNGSVDEDIPCDCDNGDTEICDNNDEGQCESGIRTCVNNQWGVCEGFVGPAPEVCNDLDDNCDGSIDEGLDCVCDSGDTQSCGSDVGQCEYGTQTCDTGGQWGTCEGGVGPTPEICDDGIDNNCDGDIDEGLDCEAGENIVDLEDYNLSVWDLSGNYIESRDGMTLSYTLIQDTNGKVTGSGTISSDDQAANFEIKGKVKAKNNVADCKIAMKGIGTYQGYQYKSTEKLTLMINKNSLCLDGTSIEKECTKGLRCQKNTNAVSIPLPDGMTGEARLKIDSEPNLTGQKFAGTGELILSNGDEYPLSFKGKYKSKTGETKYTLKGPKGIKFKLIINEGSGDATSIKAKALGQTLKYIN